MSLQKFACPHTAHTGGDGDGYAICLKCGVVIRLWLSKRMIDRAIDAGLKRESAP